MSLCEDCVTVFTHEGTPEGTWKKLGGVDCYIATPSKEYPTNKVILYLPDALGPWLRNAQLLADDFARQGFKTVILDYLDGDPVPDPDDPNVNFDKFDLWGWVKEHNRDRTRPFLDNVISALKAEGVTDFGATGYCFGGRYTFDLAFDNIIKVAVVSHPSLLEIPADLEKYKSTAKAPLLINSCTIDSQLPPEAQAKADEVLGEGKFSPGYKREYFEGCKHGFAVRGDMKDDKVKAGKEGAFTAAIKWFEAYL